MDEAIRILKKLWRVESDNNINRQFSRLNHVNRHLIGDDHIDIRVVFRGSKEKLIE